MAPLTKQRKTNLLDLPFDILQLIALYLNVATFYIWPLVCKKLLHAANDRRIILYHLQHLPGLRQGFETMSTPQLWTRFRTQAAKSLCGAGVLADIKSYASSSTYRCNSGSSRYKVSKPVFSFALPALIAMADDLGIIRIFILDDRGIRLTAELHPPSVELGGSFDAVVLKMAFSSSNDLAVLYQPLNQTQEVSPFYQRTTPVPLMVVIYRPRLSSHGDISYSVEEYEPVEVPGPEETECISLAVAPNGNVCVGWLDTSLGGRTHFWLVLHKFRKPSLGTSPNIVHLFAFPKTHDARIS